MLSLPFLTLTSSMHLPSVKTVLIKALDSYQEAALMCKAAIQQQYRAHPGFGALRLICTPPAFQRLG